MNSYISGLFFEYLAAFILVFKGYRIRHMRYKTNMGEIVAEAMSRSYDTDIDCAIVNGGSIRIDDVLSGDVSAIDIFRVLPYGGEVLKVKLKGSLLNEVLDYGEKASGTGAYLQRYNIKKSDKDEWLIQNEKILDDKIYMIKFR